MNNDDPQDTGQESQRDEQARQRESLQDAKDIQPAPTGANRGSPAAPVMKEFQKTRNESTGRS